MHTIRFPTFCAIFLAAVVGAPAYAQAGQDDLTASIEVTSGCGVVASDMDFGTPGPGATAVNATANVGVRCTGLLTFYRVYLDRGVNAQGQQRRMRGTTGDFIAYNVYSNSQRSQQWPANGRLGLALGSGIVNWTVYGRVPVLNTSQLVGSYEDTITVTVEF